MTTLIIRAMRILFSMLLLAVLVVGCDTLRGPNQGYIAPAVEGCVIDASTGEPVKGVLVKRYLERPGQKDPLDTRGATKLLQVPTDSTDSDGSFHIVPERGGYLLFEHPGVYELFLTLQRRHYEVLVTNVDLVKIKPFKTNNVLTVHVGDLPIRPKSNE